ncbi:hypothetical protein BAE44_0014633 [Dichanthelium oligosanthes]|uniref:Uncharacterized protein n=1 Tax=Dichanthelium oligosanthes TaxID=888268 RepID=A0A1E5VGS4_9POAL|nr:hypothetical protein BAE44_0014633 [Dichanthelium oligosanthes]
MAAALETDSPDTLRLLEEHVPRLAAVMEQVRHLLDIVAVDEAAASEAKSKKRRQVQQGGNGGFKGKIMVSAAAVTSTKLEGKQM